MPLSIVVWPRAVELSPFPQQRQADSLSLGACIPVLFACASPSGENMWRTTETTGSVLLTVQNDNYSDATIHANWGGARERLGFVVGKTTQTFTFNWRREDIRLIDTHLYMIGNGTPAEQWIVGVQAAQLALNGGWTTVGSDIRCYSYTKCPSRIVPIEGNCSTTVGSWLTNTTVFPYAVDKDRRSFVIARAFSVSKFPVGSSARIRAGSLASERAMATRCCSPPLNSSGRF